MVAFLRKVSALVVAAALILCTSIPAFASVSSSSLLVNNSTVSTFSSGTFSYPTTFSANSFAVRLYLFDYIPSYYVSSFSFDSSSSFTDIVPRALFFPSDGSATKYIPLLSYSLTPDPRVSSRYSFEAIFDLSIPDISSGRIEIYFTPDSEVEISNFIFGWDVFNSSFPMPTLPPSDGSDIPGVVGDVFGTVNSISGLVDLNIDWSGMTYGITNWFSDEFSPFLLSLFSSVQSGFVSLTGNIGSFFSSFFNRLDQQEDNYTAVTDPSTSQEIQDTQQMIDNVENFEASLNQSITTEFNKIDFTTPTNLAAPVAYVGDKVTRSINALGNYQPLIFVPLTLGIMLIMLGRGVTALGSMVSSSRRAASSNKSKGDDS